MSKILGSASKIVFILLTISACVGLFMGIVSENNFMLLCTGAFAFYFSKPADAVNGSDSSVTGK